MESFQFIDIILLAMVAGFVVLRLRSVLGRRTGHEPSRDAQRRGPARERFPTGDDDDENVVSLPQAGRHTRAPDIEPAYRGTPLEKGLTELKLADPAFDTARFLSGSMSAFEMIVAAYAKHDTDTLKPLLSPEVYGQFATAIQDREDRHETLETELVVLKPAKLESVEMQGSRAIVGVRFQSEQVNLVKNAQGEIIDGDKDHVDSVTDIWTFSRDTNSRDPNWTLIATRSVE